LLRECANSGGANRSRGAIGITFTKATISNPRQPRRGAIELEFLIDTGAIFSVLPGPIARKLAIAKLDREEFTLADGTRCAYDVGEAFFELDDRRGASKVVFGPANVTPLLGALTLETLGLMVNPVTRAVSPKRLFLTCVVGRSAPSIRLRWKRPPNPLFIMQLEGLVERP
jgi:clan AA aspartic protease